MLKSSKRPNRELTSSPESSALALQKERRFPDAIAAQHDALKVIDQGGSYPGERDGYSASDTYYLLADAYHHEGKRLQLAEGIVTGLPAEFPPDKAGAVAGQLNVAARAFLQAADLDQTIAVARRIMKLAESMKGKPDARFWRGEALARLYEVALRRGDKAEAQRLMRELHDNLDAYETDVAAACPGIGSAEDTTDEAQRAWFRRLGDAYHNAACQIAFLGKRDKAQALKLMKRAASLRDCPPTHLMLAAWTVAVESDRSAALQHLRHAVRAFGERRLAFLRRQFQSNEDFQSVRDDAEFRAVLGL